MEGRDDLEGLRNNGFGDNYTEPPEQIAPNTRDYRVMEYLLEIIANADVPAESLPVEMRALYLYIKNSYGTLPIQIREE